MPTKDGIHYLDPDLLERKVEVLVIGAGGSGSHMVADLAVLHQSMLDLGHPHGLSVTVIDHDTVSESNTHRARFYASDVGNMKAETIVNRVNICYGLSFRAINEELTDDSGGSVLRSAHIVIGCVDTRKSRRAIRRSVLNTVSTWKPTYVLDLGNGEMEGQVVLGEMGGKDDAVRLPCVTDLFPEMLNQALDPVDNGPSCSRAEALTRQGAFVNKAASLHAITMLSVLFRYGQIDHCATFFNMLSGRTSVLPCRPEAWERFGYRAGGASEPTAVEIGAGG
ncbi:PRTRC system ThiF family protein [Ottowia sp.]|uniref:PRTRC system ThiF family protein n=1 Tax=Ottowia sp. TaxID=1898956 RepID=UPI0025CEFE51|nr:PRTRC system ThiF family protein [Ottowia sp.]MBK6616374.1 PRTRC system ThiF family protein [Ottowia sp.]